MRDIFHTLRAAGLTTLAALALAGCADDALAPGAQGTRLVRFEGEGGMAATRSTLTPQDGGGLSFAWQTGDQVVVSLQSDGTRLGTLTAARVSDDGQTATFRGDLDVPSGVTGLTRLTVAYLGNGQDIPQDDGTHQLPFSVGEQLGTAADMGHHDVMFCKSLSVDLGQATASGTFQMEHLMAFEDYNFDLPKGVTLSDEARLTLHGRHVYTGGKLNMMTGEMEDLTEDSIEVSHAGRDFRLSALYVAVVPHKDMLMTATCAQGDDEYEYTPASAKDITAGHYYRPQSATAEAKHLVDPWVTVESQDELDAALDTAAHAGQDLKIKIRYAMGLYLPSSLEGIHSVVFKGVSAPRNDGSHKDKLMTCMTAERREVAPSTTQGSGEQPLKDSDGNPVYQTQGSFESKVYNETDNEYTSSAVTSAYTKCRTATRDNTPLWKKADGGYTTDQSESMGEAYYIVTSASGSHNMKYEGGKLVELPTTWKTDSARCYLNPFGELTTLAQNPALYTAHKNICNGTCVKGVASISFIHLALTFQPDENSSYTPLNLQPTAIDWSQSLFIGVGANAEDFGNGLTLKIRECDVDGPMVTMLHQNVEVDNCKWSLNPVNSYGSSWWKEHFTYCMIQESTSVSVRNTRFTASNSPMFNICHNGQLRAWDVTGQPAYVADIAFEGCTFTCTGTTNKGAVFSLDPSHFDPDDRVTLRLSGCSQTGAGGWTAYLNPGAEYNSKISVSVTN